MRECTTESGFEVTIRAREDECNEDASGVEVLSSSIS